MGGGGQWAGGSGQMGKWLATPMSRSVIKIRHPPVHACAKHLTGPIPTFLLGPWKRKRESGGSNLAENERSNS